MADTSGRVALRYYDEDGTPLNGLDYQPRHAPVNGLIPDIVKKWAVPSQIRWFSRFHKVIDWGQDCIAGMWVEHDEHRGPCCPSCRSEAEDGMYDIRWDGFCCCRSPRI